MSTSKPEGHFHQHRDKEYVTQYFPEIYGTIKQGPSTNTIIALVQYRRSDASLGYFVDLRFNSYSVKTNRYYNSRKGISIPPKLMKSVIDTLNSLPLDAPKDLPKEGNQKVATFTKYRNIDLCISMTHADGSPKLDIREWVRDYMHGYEGFTYKGVRFNYELIPQFSNVLMTIYDKMLEKGLTTMD